MGTDESRYRMIQEKGKMRKHQKGQTEALSTGDPLANSIGRCHEAERTLVNADTREEKVGVATHLTGVRVAIRTLGAVLGTN